MAIHNEIGKLGEQITANWLITKGYFVIERNYLRKIGEIDIICRDKIGDIHFIEVKSVSYETIGDLNSAISRETWRPEENVHSSKLTKLRRTIETWLAESKYLGNFTFDVVTVRMVPREKYAKVMMLKNLIFEE